MLLHIAAWLLFLSWPFIFDSHDPNRPARTISFWIPMIIGNLILLGLFYLNIYLLIPSLLRKRGWVFYLGAVVICFFSYAFISWEIRKQFPPRRFNREMNFKNDDATAKNNDGALRHDNKNFPRNDFRFTYFFSIVPFLLVFGLSTSLKFSEDIANFEKREKKRKMRT
ncbi:MAG: hypothetical protein WDN75_13450 [Bacteroidota bacterium]